MTNKQDDQRIHKNSIKRRHKMKGQLTTPYGMQSNMCGQPQTLGEERCIAGAPSESAVVQQRNTIFQLL